ncbi:hypothetical protein EDB92DRAFT_389083 [Lactarius akahatsu]|uniref:Uncharacterized protein n=1 Tax=Lactarius akahatsu TaxID=416441 RepID=A0AAD4Q5E5_9AGAM|nr:hypothetical protein EDB92DRAFT_389083 [Lactarius akahatsu]
MTRVFPPGATLWGARGQGWDAGAVVELLRNMWGCFGPCRWVPQWELCEHALRLQPSLHLPGRPASGSLVLGPRNTVLSGLRVIMASHGSISSLPQSSPLFRCSSGRNSFFVLWLGDIVRTRALWTCARVPLPSCQRHGGALGCKVRRRCGLFSTTSTLLLFIVCGAPKNGASMVTRFKVGFSPHNVTSTRARTPVKDGLPLLPVPSPPHKIKQKLISTGCSGPCVGRSTLAHEAGAVTTSGCSALDLEQTL